MYFGRLVCKRTKKIRYPYLWRQKTRIVSYACVI